MPLTHSGKINRRALPHPEPIRERPPMDQLFISPSTFYEKKLSSIWCDVLSLKRVGVDDSFFDMGGTSILGIKVSERIKQELGLELPPLKIYQYPNIRSLAKFIGNNESDSIKSNEIFE